MSRFRSLLHCAALAGSLIGFTHGAALAGTAGAGIANLQSPPQALAQPSQPAAALGAARTLRGPEQRLALVIGNANYQNAPQLQNPDNDAQSMARFLNSAGFEVIAATDLTQNDMIRTMQDFSSKIAAHGPNTVAMIYYAGHGVQLAGENYLVPVDAKISSPSDLVNDSVRLVDVMATLEAIPSRMRIVLLDACRNNPFPGINDAGRGLAIVDAPNGSIVGYSTAPGTEALDGSGGHSPYTSAFLHLAGEPNLPIEQLFKRIRLEVNHSTDGAQTPWESSSLTSDFYFFGDTAVAATRAPAHGPVVQMASNLPNRSVRQAYDYVLSEGSVAYYEEFIRMFPHDPLCDRIRFLLANLVEAAAWHNAVLANTPLAYQAFYEKYNNGSYAQTALKLKAEPKMLPLLQPAHLIVPQHLAPTLRFTGGSFHVPSAIVPQQPTSGSSSGLTGIVTLPAPVNTTGAGNGNGGTGKIVTLPAGSLGRNGPAEEIKGHTTIKPIVTGTATSRQQLQATNVKNAGVFKLNRDPQPQTPKQTVQSFRMNGDMGGNSGRRFAMGGAGGGHH